MTTCCRMSSSTSPARCSSSATWGRRTSSSTPAVEDNYALLAHLDEFPSVFGLPVLAGISRKSMITKVLDITPAEALNGTTVLNTLCLTKGASILRVHDVRPAVEAVRLVQAMQAQAPLTINH